MQTRKVTPGSIWLEIILWLVCFPIGIVYSIWRWSSRKEVPVHSPVAYGNQEAFTAMLDELAAWHELADHVRLDYCLGIFPGRYTDAHVRDVAQKLKDDAVLKSGAGSA